MEMRVAAGRWTPLLLLATLLLASNLVSGSHFRYGTISWRPIDAEDATAAGLDSSDPVVFANLARHTVAFEFKAAYRRDYEWGKFFREQWRRPNVIGGTQAWIDGGSCYTEDSCSVLGTANPANYWLFPDISGVSYVSWEIKLAVGRSYFELNTTGPNANNEFSDTRRQCVSPFDSGDKPFCQSGDPSGTQYPTTQIDPTTNERVPYDPTYPNFVNAATVPCERVEDVEPDYCSPWSQTYGFFFGDSDINGVPLHTDVILTITETNFEVTNVGNYLLGTSSFYHTYTEAGVPQKKKDDFTPWTAYFTGGNRLTYTTERLINNHQGRFRLELTVNLNYIDVQPNNSPVMTALPVLPVPYTGRGEISGNGMLATFQVSGFDPDIDPEAYIGNKDESNEAVYYFLGSQRKMGMLLANQVPDLKFPSRWYREDYEAARQDCYQRSCKSLASGAAANFVLVGTGTPGTGANRDGSNAIPVGKNLTVGQTLAADTVNGFAAFTYEGSCSECANGDRMCTTLRTVGPLGTTIETPLNFTCGQYPPWDNKLNLAHPPERLFLDRYTGVVQWETGVNPRDVDTADYLTDFWLHRDPSLGADTEFATRLAAKGTQPATTQEPLKPGFYNVVFDVRSYSHDPDCHNLEYDAARFGSKSPHTGEDYTLPLGAQGVTWRKYTEAQCMAVDDENMIDIAYVSVPLDSLLFLYPPASWCSKSKCRNTVQGITTFRDEGFYGTQNDVNVRSTGSCTICGGGEWNLYDQSVAGMTDKELNLTDYTVCLQDNDCGYDFDTITITPAIEAEICKRNMPPKWVNQVVAGEQDGNTPTPRLADRPTWPTLRAADGTLASDPFIDGVPVQNVYPGLALFLGQRSAEVRFNLTAVDEDDCVEMQIMPIGLFRGYTMYNLDANGKSTGSQACTYKDSFAGNDGNIGANCIYNMQMEFIKRIGTTSQFYRTFVWPANDTLPQIQDPRPPNVVVCFVPFDNYQVGIRRCVNIILSSEQQLFWIDARAKLVEQFGGTNDAFNSIVSGCVSTVTGSNLNLYQNPCQFTPADLTTFYVSPGHLLEFYMTALQDSGNPPIGIYITEGGNMMANGQVGPPEGATFVYTQYDENSGQTHLRDPAKRKFSWTPKEGQQCKYVLCFIANNTRELESAIDVTETFSGARDERCYTIVVADQQLDMQAGSFVDAAAVLPSLTSDCGMTFSMWFYPEGTTTMALATFGYTEPGETADKTTIVYMLEWDPVTAVVFHDSITVQDLGQFYRLKFSTGQSYIIQTDAEFCVDQWHFLTFTIAPNGDFILYLDGVETTHYSDDDRDFHVVAVETGSMPVVDGKVEIIGDILNNNPGYTGFLRLGSYDEVQTFNGMIGDVRIYSRVLTAEEIGVKQFVPLTATSEVGLMAYYKFNDGNQALNTVGNPAGQFNKYRAQPPAGADPDCDLAGDTYCNDAVRDAPVGPFGSEMKAKGQSVTDLSGNNNHAIGCNDANCRVESTMFFVFGPSPITPPCPQETSPDVVHVDGGAPIAISGVGFAKSQWLKCSFSMSDGSIKVIKAVHSDNNTIICLNPGSPDLTVSALEVTNGGVNFFTNFQIPIYMMERVVSFPETGGKVTITDACDMIGTNLFSMGAWVYPLSQSSSALEDVISLTGLTSDSQTGMLSVRYNGVRFVVHEKIGNTETPLGESSPAPAHNMGEGSGWHYVMLSGNTDRLVLYMDGESFELTAASISMSKCDLELGTSTSGRKAFFGYVEEMSAFSGFLEACDAYQIMWGNFTRFPITPVGETVQKTAATVSPVQRALYLRFNGVLDPTSNLVTVPDQSDHGYPGILSGDASLLWTTVPFLKPSFNRRRPRVGPPISSFRVPIQRIEGPNGLMTENYTFPRMYNDFYEHAYLPGEELMEKGYGEKSTIRMQVDGRKNLNILGFGFAESKWLKCSFDGERVPAKYVSIDEVTCDLPAVENPGMYSLGVMNLYPDFADESCVASHNTRNAERGSPAGELAAFIDNIELKESSLSFDGVNDYAISQALVKALNTPSWTGVTFGGWFMPKNTSEDKEQPILCFATKCEQVASSPPPPSPPPPSPPPTVCTEAGCADPETGTPFPPPSSVSPPPGGGPDFTFVSGSIQPYAQFCLMYKNGSVYLHSQLTSNTYNDLYFNTSTAVPVEAGHWHYAEITIDGTEISPMINSDSEAETGNIPTYIATMIVDNVTYDGSMDNGDFRVAVHPESLGNGTFYMGGLGCDMMATEISMENFGGLIDEVRVFKGVHKTEWFARLDIEEEKPLAYYRMSTMAGQSQNLYSLTPKGNLVEDFSGNGHDLTFYEFGTDETIERKQTYVFEAAPWEAASTRNIMDMTMDELDHMMMDADQTVIVEGYNVADTPWLSCLFYSANVTDAKTVEIMPLPLVEAEYVDDKHVRCKAPPSNLPIMGYVQIANPRANELAEYTYMDSALEFEGDMLKNMEIIGGTANAGESVDLMCPEGMRMDKVMFASYGRPMNRCNFKQETECDNSKTDVPCDYLQYEVNEECHSDTDKPPYWTIDRVEKICYGKSSCSIAALDSVFGDPCPSMNKWLEVAMRCSDRWTTKDYLQADEVTSQLTTGEYTFGAWVYPHSKPGVQAIVSFGAAMDSSSDVLNNAILQWRGDEGGNTGRFYYYDDCVYDVLMKYTDGRDIVVASHQWYQVFLTRSEDGVMRMYLNGHEVACWNSVCAPDPEGTFILGMDLSDEMYPKEFFDGLLDEVVVYNRTLDNSQIQMMMCWSNKQDLAPDGLVVYYRFNRDLGAAALALDESPFLNHGHLAQSSDNLWSNETGMFGSMTPTIHTSYTYMGVPWFPASTYSAHVQPMNMMGAMEGELVGGQEVTIKGLNFAPRVSRVFYDDKEIVYEFVDMTTMTATIPNIKEDMDSVSADAFELELSVVNSLPSEDSESCAAGSGSMQEDDVTFTQQLGVRDHQHGLVCYFPFLGSAEDYSGGAKHGTVVGASLVDNRDHYPEQAMHFEAEDYVEISGCEGRTVAMWINYDDLEFPVVHRNNLPFEAYEPETGCQTSVLSTQNNAWLFVVGIVNDDLDLEMMYLNGVANTNHKLREQVLSILFDKKIGGDDFVGKIDDVWIWDRELTLAEIGSLFRTDQYALEFGFGTEMHMEMSMEAQGPPGLLAKYYGAGIEHSVIQETMSNSYSTNSPFNGLSADDWSLEMTGYIYAPFSQEYIFSVTADDSFRLWINTGSFTVDLEAGSGWGRNGPAGAQDGTNWVSVINEPCQGGSTTVTTGGCPEREVQGNIELFEGWYEIYFSYSDKSGAAAWALQWQTTDGDVAKQLIPKQYLRAGTGPTIMEAWVYPYRVDGDHAIASQSYFGELNGASFGIYKGGVFASVYIGCLCGVPKCDEYRTVRSWKAPVVANAWQHILVMYDGASWTLKVDGVLDDSFNFLNTFDTTNANDNFLDPFLDATTSFTSYKKYFVETRSPLVFGRENSKEVIMGSPDDARMFHGLIYNFAKWGNPPKDLIRRCPLDGDENTYQAVGDQNGYHGDLMVYLMLNEGVGLKAYDQSGNGILKEYYKDAVITPPPSPLRLWVNATSLSPGLTSFLPKSNPDFDPNNETLVVGLEVGENGKPNFVGATEVMGTALEQAIAGKCAVVSIQSFDECSHKRHVGGDPYVMEITGPLHLNSETILLTVGDGIVDMMDGSYVATFSRNVSGYYQIKVCDCSCDDAVISGTNCQGEIHKSTTYVHPYVADSHMSYIYDTEDALYLDEVKESMAGLPVEFMLQTVDVYGNLRTAGGITDWALEFNGPQNFFGEVKDNNDGSYTFSYTAHVAGDYRMQVRMFDEPICASGGSTCCGGTKSDYEYCTVATMPADPTNTCQQCVKVHDGSSLNFEKEASVPTVFPDMDALDLEGNFTVYAFISKGGDSGEAREYILSKQSDYSGKGYWLALVPSVVDGEYTLEGGVYVGGENFRIGKATVTLEMEKWAHVAMTYDGMSLKLYLDAVLVEDASFNDDDMPKFNRRNSQPLRVGKGFSGQIDNVMIWNTTREFDQFVPDSYCPAFGPEMMLQDLVAYYRFNENNGMHTKDSSHLMNDGVVGLICDMTPVGHNVHLACPTGYVIGEVLYANFGDNDGSCGNYEMGTCAYNGSMSLVETACLGMQSCMVNANSTLHPTCLSTTKSLAVNAVCVKSDDADKAAWSDNKAPTWVGVTVARTDHIVCAYDLMTEMGAAWSPTSTSTTVLPAVPEWISAHLNELAEQTPVQCSTAEGLATVTAGVPVVFALLAKDECGYRSMNEMDVFEGALVYPNLPNLTAMVEEPTCPDFPTTPHAEVPLNIKNGPDVLGYCNAWGDLYLMQFTPVTTGEAKIELMLNGEPVLDHEVVVSWGFLSGASMANGSGLMSAEAGVESMFEVRANDKDGNLRMEWGDEDHIMLNVTGAAMAAYRVERSDHMGIYNVFIMYPVEGEYHVALMVRDMFPMLEEETFRTIHEGNAMVHGAEVRPVTGLNIEFPEARFEHSMVAYDNELFIFGGARPDKTYLDSMLKYDAVLGESNPAFYSYRRKIEVENMVDEDFTVELTLDTEALIESGKLKMDCADLRFYNTDGAALALWVEPGMSPGGCGSAHTTVWIRVPGGMDWFWMYYGNKAADSMSDPMSVFEFFEDFEYEASPLENGWQLSDAATDTCTTEDGFNPGDAASFYTSEVTSMTGSRALRADTVEKMGGSLFKEMPTMGKFTMKVFMYDMLCPGAHWVSPDFQVCTPQADMKTMLPSTNTGVGVYTASSEEDYCALYPWKTTGVSRQLGWHSFTMRDDDDSLSITYDMGSENESKMELRSDNITTDISKVFIRAARLPGDAIGSSAFWDSIIVTPYNADISVSHDEEEVVVYNPEATWATVGATSPPPARQAHTAVVYDEAMYVFGGERSAYEYSDVWKYDFKEDMWAFQAPVNRSAALGRHDHSAVVYDDAMYVYGGRSPSPRDDFWKYDFRTREWVPMPTSPKMSARFGHGAAVHNGTMYVFGGYTEEENMLTNEIWEFDFHNEEWTKVGPRKVNFESTVEDPADAIVFPQQIPSPRFPQDVIITGMMPAMYVVGGVGGASMMEELPELWKFDLESKAWTLLATNPLLGRTDGAAALVSKGEFYKHIMLYGGRANGKALGDLVTMFVGETGTGDMMMTAHP